MKPLIFAAYGSTLFVLPAAFLSFERVCPAFIALLLTWAALCVAAPHLPMEDA